MYDSSYNVKTRIFEGPLDTLLSLIEKRKLFINDISLAQVADDYIAYTNELGNLPSESGGDTQKIVSDLAHFILIASTLVLIKSKSLLPNLPLTEEEQDSIVDLHYRLKEYQKYRALSVHIKERFDIAVEYIRLPSKDKVIVFTPDSQTTAQKLQEVVKFLINQLPKKEFVPKAIVQKVISLEEMIQNLTQRITSNIKMSFNDFSGIKNSHNIQESREAKVTVIVSFLAMLELVKQGIIQVSQEKDFYDIEMETHSVGVPHY